MLNVGVHFYVRQHGVFDVRSRQARFRDGFADVVTSCDE